MRAGLTAVLLFLGLPAVSAAAPRPLHVVTHQAEYAGSDGFRYLVYGARNSETVNVLDADSGRKRILRLAPNCRVSSGGLANGNASLALWHGWLYTECFTDEEAARVREYRRAATNRKIDLSTGESQPTEGNERYPSQFPPSGACPSAGGRGFELPFRVYETPYALRWRLGAPLVLARCRHKSRVLDRNADRQTPTLSAHMASWTSRTRRGDVARLLNVRTERMQSWWAGTRKVSVCGEELPDNSIAPIHTRRAIFFIRPVEEDCYSVWTKIRVLSAAIHW